MANDISIKGQAELALDTKIKFDNLNRQIQSEAKKQIAQGVKGINLQQISIGTSKKPLLDLKILPGSDKFNEQLKFLDSYSDKLKAAFEQLSTNTKNPRFIANLRGQLQSINEIRNSLSDTSGFFPTNQQLRDFKRASEIGIGQFNQEIDALKSYSEKRKALRKQSLNDTREFFNNRLKLVQGIRSRLASPANAELDILGSDTGVAVSKELDRFSNSIKSEIARFDKGMKQFLDSRNKTAPVTSSVIDRERKSLQASLQSSSRELRDAIDLSSSRLAQNPNTEEVKNLESLLSHQKKVRDQRISLAKEQAKDNKLRIRGIELLRKKESKAYNDQILYLKEVRAELAKTAQAQKDQDAFERRRRQSDKELDRQRKEAKQKEKLRKADRDAAEKERRIIRNAYDEQSKLRKLILESGGVSGIKNTSQLDAYSKRINSAVSALKARSKTLDSSSSADRRMLERIDKQVAALDRLNQKLKEQRGEIVRTGRQVENANKRQQDRARMAQGRLALARAGSARSVSRELLPDVDFYARNRIDNLQSYLGRMESQIGAKDVDQERLRRNIAKTRKEIVKMDDVVNATTRRLQGFRNISNQAADTLRLFFRYALGYGALYQALNAVTALVSGLTELDKSLKSIEAVSVATRAEMTAIRGAVKAVATETQFSVSQISESAQVLAQAGTLPRDMQEALGSVALFASATDSTLQSSADLISTIKNVYKDLTDGEIADKLTKAVNISKLTSEGLQTILSRGLQVAKAYNITADQYLAAVSVLRNAGIKDSTVSTGLRQATLELLSPDKKTIDLLIEQYKKIGEDLTGAQIEARFFEFSTDDNPMLSVLRELKKLGASGSAKSLFNRIFDVRAANVIEALLRNMDELDSSLAQIGTRGSAAQGAQVQMESLSNSLSNLGAVITSLSDTLSGDLVQSLASATREVTKFLAAYDKSLTTRTAQGESTGAGSSFVASLFAGLAGAKAAPTNNLFLRGAAGLAAGGSVFAGSQFARLSGNSALAGSIETITTVLSGYSLLSSAGLLGDAQSASNTSKLKGIVGRLAGLARAHPVGLLVTVGTLAYQMYSIFSGPNSQQQIKAIQTQIAGIRKEQKRIEEIRRSFDLRDPSSVANKVIEYEATINSYRDRIAEIIGKDVAAITLAENKLDRLVESGYDLNTPQARTLLGQISDAINRDLQPQEVRDLLRIAADTRAAISAIRSLSEDAQTQAVIARKDDAVATLISKETEAQAALLTSPEPLKQAEGLAALQANVREGLSTEEFDTALKSATALLLEVTSKNQLDTLQEAIGKNQLELRKTLISDPDFNSKIDTLLDKASTYFSELDDSLKRAESLQSKRVKAGITDSRVTTGEEQITDLEQRKAILSDFRDFLENVRIDARDATEKARRKLELDYESAYDNLLQLSQDTEFPKVAAVVRSQAEKAGIDLTASRDISGLTDNQLAALVQTVSGIQNRAFVGINQRIKDAETQTFAEPESITKRRRLLQTDLKRAQADDSKERESELQTQLDELEITVLQQKIAFDTARAGRVYGDARETLLSGIDEAKSKIADLQAGIDIRGYETQTQRTLDDLESQRKSLELRIQDTEFKLEQIGGASFEESSQLRDQLDALKKSQSDVDFELSLARGDEKSLADRRRTLEKQRIESETSKNTLLALITELDASIAEADDLSLELSIKSQTSGLNDAEIQELLRGRIDARLKKLEKLTSQTGLTGDNFKIVKDQIKSLTDELVGLIVELDAASGSRGTLSNFAKTFEISMQQATRSMEQLLVTSEGIGNRIVNNLITSLGDANRAFSDEIARSLVDQDGVDQDAIKEAVNNTIKGTAANIISDSLQSVINDSLIGITEFLGGKTGEEELTPGEGIANAFNIEGQLFIDKLRDVLGGGTVGLPTGSGNFYDSGDSGAETADVEQAAADMSDKVFRKDGKVAQSWTAGISNFFTNLFSSGGSEKSDIQKFLGAANFAIGAYNSLSTPTQPSRGSGYYEDADIGISRVSAPSRGFDSSLSTQIGGDKIKQVGKAPAATKSATVNISVPEPVIIDKSTGVRIVNVHSDKTIDDYLRSSRGEKRVLNIVDRNPKISKGD